MWDSLLRLISGKNMNRRGQKGMKFATRGASIYHVTIFRNTKMQQYVSWIVTTCIEYSSEF